MATKRKIKSLTDAQAARLPMFRAEWLAHGCSTEPANREIAQATITKMYGMIGEKAPIFLWFDSPWACCMAVGILKTLYDPNLKAVRSQLSSQLDSQLDSQLYLQLSSQLSSQLYLQLSSQLSSQLDSQLGGAALGALPVRMDMSWRSAWVAWFEFAQEIGVKYGADERAKLDLWSELARHSGWWWPYKGICVVSERPKAVHWDERGRLHHPSEPALQFRDGYNMPMWHGTRVPEAWITAPAEIEVTAALNWENIEQRRAAAEIIGWKKILDTLPHRVIDADKDPYIGTLMEVDLPDSPKEKFLRVRCGTGRDFVLPVDPKSKTALEANARTYRLKPSEYKLEART